MSQFLNLHLGVEAEERKAALLLLAGLVSAIGRKGQPSISEMLAKVADAVRYEPQRATAIMQQLMDLAGEGYVVEAEAPSDVPN